jgi:hypothetical protein
MTYITYIQYTHKATVPGAILGGHTISAEQLLCSTCSSKCSNVAKWSVHLRQPWGYACVCRGCVRCFSVMAVACLARSMGPLGNSLPHTMHSMVRSSSESPVSSSSDLTSLISLTSLTSLSLSFTAEADALSGFSALGLGFMPLAALAGANVDEADAEADAGAEEEAEVGAKAGAGAGAGAGGNFWIGLAEHMVCLCRSRCSLEVNQSEHLQLKLKPGALFLLIKCFRVTAVAWRAKSRGPRGNFFPQTRHTAVLSFKSSMIEVRQG